MASSEQGVTHVLTDEGAVWDAPESPKRFFLKVDPDAIILPHLLLRLPSDSSFIRVLAPSTPYLVRMTACRVESFHLCHAAGGGS